MDRLKELKKGAASPEDVNVEVDSDRGELYRSKIMSGMNSQAD